MLADSPEFIASFVAIISLGAIAVPINLALRREEQLFILKDCGACAAIVEGSIARDLFAGDVSDDLKNLILVGRGAQASAPELAGITVQLYETAERTPTKVSRLRVEVLILNDAFILYTSGSTGEPKGAVHTQADIFYTNETYCREVLKLREGDRLFSSSRLPFAYGLGQCVYVSAAEWVHHDSVSGKAVARSYQSGSSVTIVRRFSLECPWFFVCCLSIIGGRATGHFEFASVRLGGRGFARALGSGVGGHLWRPGAGWYRLDRDAAYVHVES